MQDYLRSGFFFLVLLLLAENSHAIDDKSYVSFKKTSGSFALASSGKLAPIFRSSTEDAGVVRAILNLQNDILLVSKLKPQIFIDKAQATQLILVGTLGKNPLIDQLVSQKKIDVSAIKGKWEASVTQVIDKPFPGVEKALVIVGSDKRGTIFGIYDLSAQIGVSPWYWWADVPVKEQKEIYVSPGFIKREPAVKYRGIFINDEAPALSGWSKEKFGGFNHKFYEHVFELILRLKGNYLWPAMWGNAFYDDDPENPKLANEMGVVIGTSHHEPLMRAHDEWRRFGKGAWNYNTNEKALQDFWRAGMQRKGTNESIVTVGMRGDGDEPMSEGSNIALLEKIVKDQRAIITETTGKAASETPQIWALYKEVQDYYDKGMRVPDDITLLLCDDNWGNIRKLPKLSDKPRSGGYGIYYHFDYVGGPRNYKWINTNPITKVWEQMHLAREYGADKLWLVNVGDIKPMEFPIEFFLDYAWNPEKWPASRLQEYTRIWAEKQFGKQFSVEIADIISKYTKYNGRRKPELVDPTTYSLSNYREYEWVVDEYNKLLAKAEKINTALPQNYRDAYFQLVLHPVKASANLYELYYTVAKNRLYAKQGRTATNDLAKRAKELFANDAAISAYYNKSISGGKWNHMMDQTHIGYTYWQQPQKDAMPEVKEITLPEKASIGLGIQGSDQSWPADKEAATLPDFNSITPESYYIDIFNTGSTVLSYKLTSTSPWIKLSSTQGTLEKELRVWVSVDWKKAPLNASKAQVVLSSEGKTIPVNIIANNSGANQPKGFTESNGYISIEAEHFNKALGDSIKWIILPDYGRTLSGVTTSPVTAASTKISNNSPRLEYELNFKSSGDIKVLVYVSPTIDFTNTSGLKYAISIDDEIPVTVNLHGENSDRDWNRSVADNIKILQSNFNLKTSGKHILKFWRIDPGVVLQKIVVDTGGLKPSYLGPPESSFK